MARPRYCPCVEETPDPCPACGATVAGDDPVHGVCQATHGIRPSPLVEIVLVNRKTGEVVGGGVEYRREHDAERKMGER